MASKYPFGELLTVDARSFLNNIKLYTLLFTFNYNYVKIMDLAMVIFLIVFCLNFVLPCLVTHTFSHFAYCLTHSCTLHCH